MKNIIACINHNGVLDAAKVCINYAVLSDINMICQSRFAPILSEKDENILQKYAKNMGVNFIATPQNDEHAQCLGSSEFCDNIFGYLMNFSQVFDTQRHEIFPKNILKIIPKNSRIFLCVDPKTLLKFHKNISHHIDFSRCIFTIESHAHPLHFFPQISQIAPFFALKDFSSSTALAHGSLSLGAHFVIKNFTDDRNRTGQNFFMDTKIAKNLVADAREILKNRQKI